MGNWLRNEGPTWLLFIVWLAVNIGLFVKTYVSYMAPKYVYLRLIIGHGLPFARSAAYLLNFNSFLVLLPVCRNLLSFTRGTSTCCKRSFRHQLDRNLVVHRYLAYFISLLTIIHVGAHCYNLERFVQAHGSEDDVILTLTNIPNGPNPVSEKGSDAIKEIFKIVPGVTGLFITLALILMITSSTTLIRRSYYEVFWFTHHLFIIYYVGLLLHGIQGVVKYQNNTDEHDPVACADQWSTWGTGECPLPTFVGNPAASWKWCLGPIILYCIERLIRLYRSFQNVTVLKVIKHPSRTFEIQMKKEGFHAEVGQYVFIRCSQVGFFQWHPFTLTSCPEDDHISVHIRIVGDWTSGLARLCGIDASEPPAELPSIAIDGPFGTASEDVFHGDYNVAVLVGAGIGVTPFASVLKSIWNKHNSSNGRTKLNLKKVYFYWLSPDMHAFEWFADLLKSLERQMAEKRTQGFIEFNIYLTRGWDVSLVRNIVSHEQSVYDLLTNLRHKTHYGRPNWNLIFSNVTAVNPGASVGVFVCGPKLLSKTLRSMCNKYSSADEGGTHFYFNKENF